MSGPDIATQIVGLTKSLRAFKHGNSVWILLAAVLLSMAAVAVLLIAVPQVGKAQGTVPSKPGDLTATVKSTQVTLRWNDPSDTSITGYEYLQAQIAKLTASDGVAGDLFGHSVAVDGDTAVVGAYEDESEKGAAYVLAKDSSGAWSQVAKLTASDGDASSDGEAGDIFGWSVAVDWDTVVAGARYDDSAYVFTKPGTGWATATETAKLTASDGVVGDWFGQSVAVDGDTVVVGASEDDGSGSAYVFTKAADSVWTDATQTAKLTASDGDDFDEFGKSVAVDGDTVVAGAPNNDGYGSAYVFIKPAAGWDDATQTAKLTPGATDDGAAGLAGTFGAAVAVGGDTVVVGASAYSGSQGRAYVFTKPSGGWEDAERTAELATSDAEKNQFGWSVAVDGNTVVVGAHTDDASDSVNDSGSVYVFTKSTDSVWADTTETVKLTATDGASGDQFGWSIAAGGGTVVVGAHWDDDKGADSGSAYVYGVSGWTAIPDSEDGATNATSYTVNDLTNEEEYGFWIRARNTVGASEASDPETATPVNTAPTAVDDATTTAEGTAVDIDVVANDTDLEGDTLQVTSVTMPSNGTAVIKSGSATTITYTPNTGFHGSDSFTYVASDGNGGTDTGTVTVTVTAVDDEPANRSPRFNEGLNTTRTVPENAEVGMAVGDPVNARDSDNDRLEYWLWGMDRASFDVDPSTGQLTTKTALDYEVKNEYSVRVSARDRRGGVDGIIVTISVENVDEPPSQPGAPEVTSTGPTGLTVRWTAPDNQGPEITDYDLQYREADGEFKDVGYDGTGTSMTLSDLKPETGYEVQVRAINAEGVSPWSESGRGETEEAPPPPTPTPAPTAEPTPAPTAEPTPAPTAEPTPAPTAEPTPAPTAEPTPAPTAEPTPAPTAEPTPAPTAEPTPAPTAEPAPSEADGGDEGFPWWAIVVVVIGVVAGVVLIIVVRRSRR